jgi:hypothetical protein
MSDDSSTVGPPLSNSAAGDVYSVSQPVLAVPTEDVAAAMH